MNIGKRPQKVLIVGGGIAGIVTAIALGKAGFQVLVTEARPRTSDGVGAFLSLAPNGVRCLRELSLANALEGGFCTPEFLVSLGNGKVIGKMTPRARDGVPTMTIRRSDLYTALRQCAESQGVEVAYGKRLREIERRERSVLASYEDGSALEADLLVGADGIHSRVRTFLNPAGKRPSYLGLLNVGGFAPDCGLQTPPGTLNFLFGRSCFFGWVQHPSGDVWWFANPAQRIEPAPEELATNSTAQWRERLLELAVADESPMERLIESSHEMTPIWPMHDLPSVETWQKDRVIIIGDAAHAASPSSGQGASLAIEDGSALAKCLLDLPDVDTALRKFDELRRPRAERIVALGRRNSSGKTPNGFGRVTRDLFFRALFPLLSRSDPMEWAYDYQVGWQSA